MVHWWWTVITLVIGVIAGFSFAALCLFFDEEDNNE